MARLDVVKADEAAPSVVFQRITEGETLAQIAAAWRVPKGRFVEWFTTRHEELYDAALKVRAADLAFDAMAAALAATPEDVAVRKLQAEVALKLAAKFDRARFGETVRVEKQVTFQADLGLLGTAAALLEQRRGRVVEALPEPAEVLI